MNVIASDENVSTVMPLKESAVGGGKSVRVLKRVRV